MRNVRTVVLAGLASLLAACDSAGGEVDNTSSFTGDWAGSGGFAMQGNPQQPLQGLGGIAVLGTQIRSSSLNVVELTGICPGGEGVPASVTGPFTFSVGSFSCAPATSSGCSSPTLVRVDGGSGTLVDGALTVAMTGSYSWCGGTFAFAFSFAGTRE